MPLIRHMCDSRQLLNRQYCLNKGKIHHCKGKNRCSNGYWEWRSHSRGLFDMRSHRFAVWYNQVCHFPVRSQWGKHRFSHHRHNDCSKLYPCNFYWYHTSRGFCGRGNSFHLSWHNQYCTGMCGYCKSYCWNLLCNPGDHCILCRVHEYFLQSKNCLVISYSLPTANHFSYLLIANKRHVHVKHYTSFHIEFLNIFD